MRSRQRDARASGDGARHQARLRQRGRAVVHAGVRDVHARQLTDDRLELERRLQRALAHLRLVRRVARQELAAHRQRIDERRAEVAVRARAEKARVVGGRAVLRRDGAQLVDQLELGERVRQAQLGIAIRRRDVVEQLVGRRCADDGEHLAPVVLSERDVGMLHGLVVVVRSPGFADRGSGVDRQCSSLCLWRCPCLLRHGPSASSFASLAMNAS